MRILLKVKFNASKERFEKFGDNKYLVYLPFEEDAESKAIIAQMLSQKLGAPVSRIEFVAIESITKNWIFEIR